MVIIMASISSASTILDEKIEASEQEAIETMKKMIAIPSISPLSGGEGESKRADFLELFLKSFGLEITECIAESPRIYSWDECETKGV
jgi:acetylornithine deacetylase/succinyl-diaminopimelate desuccinylase-like protein